MFQSLPDTLPDLVGISATTPSAPIAYALASQYRELAVPVILGGSHVSVLPSEALRHADSVFVGEAEDRMAEVLTDAESGSLKPVYHGR